MRGEVDDSDYADRQYDFSKSDIRLPSDLDEQAKGLQNERDPLAPKPDASQSKDSDELGRLISKVLRFHPFMRLFNVCATSMYLDKARGERMRLFSESHPRFRRVCMIGEFVFTALLALLILWAIGLTVMKFFGVNLTWPIVLSVPCVGR